MTKTREKFCFMQKVTMEDTTTEITQDAGNAETLHTLGVIQKQDLSAGSFPPKSRDLLQVSVSMTEGRSNLSQHACSETPGDLFTTKRTFDQQDYASGSDKCPKVGNSDRCLVSNSSVTKNRGEEIRETNIVQTQRPPPTEKSFVPQRTDEQLDELFTDYEFSGF